MRNRERVVPTWHPTWTPDIERSASKIIRTWINDPVRKWNLDTALEGFDDLMQEAKILFLTLERKYPVANNMAHFSSLFRTSLTRALIDKDRARRRKGTIPAEPIDEVVDDLCLQGIPNYGYFNVLLEEMPSELKLVLRALTSGRVRLKLDRPTPARPRENFNMRLKRRFPELTLIDPAGDLQRVLKYNH